MKLERIGATGLCLLALLNFSSTYTASETLVQNAAAAAKTVEQRPDDVREATLRTTLDQLGTLEFLVQGLYTDVHGGIARVPNKIVTEKDLADLAERIRQIMNKPYLRLEDHELCDLVGQVVLITQNVSHGIETSFSNWNPNITTRSSRIELSLQDMKDITKLNEAELKKLQNQAPYVGIGASRWLYRRTCNGLSKLGLSWDNTGKMLRWSTALMLIAYFAYPEETKRRVPVLFTTLEKVWDKFCFKHIKVTQVRDPNGQNRDLPEKAYIKNPFTGGELNPTFGVLTTLGALGPLLVKDLATWGKDIAKKVKNAHYGLKGLPVPPDDERIPTSGFEDVIGNEEILRELNKYVELYVDPDRFVRKKIDFQHGVLFLGPTRSGKTYLAEKFCGEINKRLKELGRTERCKFWTLDAARIKAEERAGWSLLDIIEYVRSKEAPCILFIDEIHTILDGDKERLNQLLVGMSGVFKNPQDKPLLIIAATNQANKIDIALRQNGRFGTEFTLSYPSFNERRQFLQKALKESFITLDNDQLNALAHETEGHSFEDLRHLIQYMQQEANIHRKPITTALFDEALDKVIRRMKDGGPLSAGIKEVVATHQASTIVATKLLEPTRTITKATIVPVELINGTDRPMQQGAVFSYGQNDDANVKHPRALEIACKRFLAGHAGEIVLFGSSAYSYPYETERAFTMCKQLCSGGLRESAISQSSSAIDQLVRDANERKQRYERAVMELLAPHKAAIQEIAKELAEKETLTGTEIEQLCTRLITQPVTT